MNSIHSSMRLFLYPVFNCIFIEPTAKMPSVNASLQGQKNRTDGNNNKIEYCWYSQCRAWTIFLPRFICCRHYIPIFSVCQGVFRKNTFKMKNLSTFVAYFCKNAYFYAIWASNLHKKRLGGVLEKRRRILQLSASVCFLATRQSDHLPCNFSLWYWSV